MCIMHLSNVCHEHLTLRSYIQKPILMDMIYEAVEPFVHRQSPGILQLYRENKYPEKTDWPSGLRRQIKETPLILWSERA